MTCPAPRGLSLASAGRRATPDLSREDATMCLITMGLMAALAPAALYVGLMVWKDGGETPQRSDARAPQRTMRPHQPASSTL
jgi:hypothetical protein